MLAVFVSAVLLSYAPGTIVLSEIMYNPDGQTLGLDEHMEWFELYNASDEGLNLAGMMITDGNNQIYLGHYLLAPGAYGVVCANDASFKSIYGNDVRLIPWSGEWTRLRNSSDELILYGEDGTVMESVTYYDSWGVNGTEPSPADGDGSSLERIDPTGPNDETNWAPSRDFNHTAEDGDPVCWGTPGAENSVAN